MSDLALIVGLIFMAVLTTGPLSVWLAVKRFEWASLFIAAMALMFGVHWFANIQTSIRFIGILSAILGVVAIWYTMRLSR